MKSVILYSTLTVDYELLFLSKLHFKKGET